MKIVVISPDNHRLHEIGSGLNAFRVTLIEGGLGKLRAAAEAEKPDLIVLDARDDPFLLIQVEYVASSFPQMAIVILSQAPTQEFLLQAMRAGVREVLPSPVSPASLTEAVRRVAARQVTRDSKSPGKIVAFMSCKGGSGATFIATNLGHQLAQRHSVLLIDLNLQFGDAISFMHDDKPVATIADLTRDMGRLDASLLSSSAIEITPNYRILAAPEDPAEASAISAAHIDAILALALTQYDYVLIDVARTLDPASIKSLDRADRIYTVLQAGVPYLRNAVKLQAAFRGLGYPPEKLEWIVNRFEKGGQIGLDDIRRPLAADRLNVIGNATREVSSALNLGRPLLQVARASPVAKNLHELMLSIDPAPPMPGKFFHRLFQRT